MRTDSFVQFLKQEAALQGLLFGGENLKNVMSKIGMRAGEPIEHPWINKSIEKAQTKVENRNFDIRKHLLEYDDVLNEQRSFIYEQRNAILADENLIERIYATLEEFISEKFDEYSSSSKAEKEERARLIKDIFREKFFCPNINCKRVVRTHR